MADMILFDKLAFIDRLKRAGIEDDQARAHAEAMEDRCARAWRRKRILPASKT
jgi:hypothetical protein